MDNIGRFFHEPKGSFFLFGPRGTGKSTWLRQRFPKAVWIDLLQPDVHRAYLARPERLNEVISGSPSVTQIVIDEIQKVPALLDAVHSLIETDSKLRFVLTGSSARKIRHGAANLLAGRVVETAMHPFMAAELGDNFNLEHALQFGIVPLVISAEDPQATLKSYASLYLNEEVQAEGLVRNIGNFSRFLEGMSYSHGGVLNMAEVARECEVGRKTVQGYLEILEDLLLGFRIPIFTKRAKRHLASHPKFYYFDTGVFRSLRPKGPLDHIEEIEGVALEGLVAQHLRAWINYSNNDSSLYYWRTKSGNEVDFVVYGPDVFCAIEVKRKKRLGNKDVKGLRAFKQDYPEAQACLVYMGTERLVTNGILCLPCKDFLLNLTPGNPIIPM